MIFRLATSAEREVKDSRQECFKEAPECPEVASELVPDIFEFLDLFLFLFIFLATNIDCKSILQKTLKQSVISTRTVLPCLCVLFFRNPAAVIMLNMLFNTLLKITPHNRQKRKRRRKERTK